MTDQPTNSTDPRASDAEGEEEVIVPPYQPMEDDVTYFAQTNFRGANHRFGIRRMDRRRHLYVIGKTGMGKSTMLENMIIQDIQNGEGLAVVDPHGDLAEKVIKYVPSHRINDVIYINPADTKFPIGFNVLENVDPEYMAVVANGVVGVFKKIWADSWGPRLEYILINTILALLGYPNSTLLGVMRMLVDPAFRKKVVKKIDDPVVRSFWVNEFNNYTEKFRNEAIAPIQNKVGQFLSSSLIRNIVGQPKSTFNMREAMDSGKIVILNLSKGRLGEENAALLGALMITKIQLAAMSRVDIPEEERRDFYLYVDEFQNFSTDSFASILSEARKYRLNITMAHQYIEQLSDEVRAAVFGNAGTMVSFRVGATDAEELEKEYAPVFTQEDIVTLPAYQIYLRLMISGVASDPFSANTLPPIAGETDNVEKVIAQSRERYAQPGDKVAQLISEWSAVDAAQAAKIASDQQKMDGMDDDEGDADDEDMGGKGAGDDSGELHAPSDQEVEDLRTVINGIPQPPVAAAPPPPPVRSEEEQAFDALRSKQLGFLPDLDETDEEVEDSVDDVVESDSEESAGKIGEEEPGKQENGDEDASNEQEERKEQKKQNGQQKEKEKNDRRKKEDDERKEQDKKQEQKKSRNRDGGRRNDRKKEASREKSKDESRKKSDEQKGDKKDRREDRSNSNNDNSQQQGGKSSGGDSNNGDQPKKKRRRRRRKRGGSKKEGGSSTGDSSSKPNSTSNSKSNNSNRQGGGQSGSRKDSRQQKNSQPQQMKPGQSVTFD